MKFKPDRTSSCLQCRMYTGLCFCSSMPHFDLATKVVIFMHQKEYNLLTNTGILAHRILTNSKIVFRGHPSRKVVQREEFLQDEEVNNAYILFPSPEAIDLDAEFMKTRKGPITLICPDGHWGQAKRVVRHEPSLQQLPCVKIPVGLASQYRLRRNIVAGNICTFEAIARAVGVLEGELIQDVMETTFNKMVTRLLWTQGKIPLNEVAW